VFQLGQLFCFLHGAQERIRSREIARQDEQNKVLQLSQPLCFLYGVQERIRSREIEGDDRAVTTPQAAAGKREARRQRAKTGR